MVTLSYKNKDGAFQSGALCLYQRIQETSDGSPSCSGPLVAATGCNSLVSPCRKALAHRVELISWMRSSFMLERSATLESSNFWVHPPQWCFDGLPTVEPRQRP